MTSESLGSIWGTGPNDIWIGTSWSNELIHYDGTGWATVSTPGYSVSDIWGASPNEYWAVSEDRIYSYDGTQWTAGPRRSVSLLGAITGTSSSDVWVAGLNNTLFHRDAGGWHVVDLWQQDVPRVWGSSASDVWIPPMHFTGSVWEQDFAVHDLPDIRGMWSSSPNDIWTTHASGQLSHFDGNQWTSVSSPIGEHMYGIWGSAPDDVWAVGSNGLVIRYDGVDWVAQTVPVSEHLSAVWGSSSTDVWFAGNNGSVMRFDGATFTQVATPTTENLNALWGSSSSDVWCVGQNGTVLRFAP